MPPLPKDICMGSRTMKIEPVVIRFVIDKHPIVCNARHMAFALADKIAGQRMVFEQLLCRNVISQLLYGSGEWTQIPMPSFKELEATLEF